jgi:hypothetical protein
VTTPNPSVAGAPHLVQALADTVTAGPGSGDVLATRELAIPWLRSAGLLAADATLTGSEHGALLRLRNALRDAVAAHASAAGTAADPGVAARLTRALADGRLVVTIEPSGAVKLATAARSAYPAVVAGIAVAIAEADAAGHWPGLA